MILKTFTAPSMNAALTLVKRELGANAVILHTRTYKRGGLFGLGAKNLVEITASDSASVAKARKKSTPHPNAPPAPKHPHRHPSFAKPQTPTHYASPQAAAGDLIRRTYAAAKAELAKQQPAPSTPPHLTQNPRPQTPDPGPHPPSPIGPSNEQLVEEMRAVQRLVGKMMLRNQNPDAPPSNITGSLHDQYVSLLKQEVTEELAEEIVAKVNKSLPTSDLQKPDRVMLAVRQAIADLLPADNADPPLPTADRRPRTIALVGPTGVGKTTTIAKLAANFKLKQKQNVALITLDTYRIAAVDQLRTYANIIGVPLHVVSNTDELAQTAQKCAHCDAVLIDTAGRSQKDDPKLDQLATFLQIANPHEVHLVLSSTCNQSVLLDTVERFSRVRTDRIIFTKLDEAVTYGVLLNVARKVNKRLSFITTGQEVPHHIEPGRPERLADLVLGKGGRHAG